MKLILRYQWWRAKRTAECRSENAVASPLKPLQPFSTSGNCGTCGFNRANGGEWREGVDAGSKTGVCAIRGFEIREPATTYCKNFDSRDAAPFGATYAILRAHEGSAVPWLELAVPHVAPAHCCECGVDSESGVVLDLPEQVRVECCGPAHYLQWWSDYQRRRLEYFKQLGERAYSDMYDVVFSGANAHYSNAKDAFHSAIAVACDLAMREEQHALEQRLSHIKDVYRHQFR